MIEGLAAMLFLRFRLVINVFSQFEGHGLSTIHTKMHRSKLQICFRIPNPKLEKSFELEESSTQPSFAPLKIPLSF